MKAILIKLSEGKKLSEDEAHQAILSMMSDDHSIVSDSEIASFLSLLARRELSVDELVGATKAMRCKMTAVKIADSSAIDTCGTGGSGYDTFNTSTLSAFLLASAGVTVAKHGNRAATSRCGSADLLEALGYNLDLSLDKIPELAAQTNFCFFFAPKHHPATKRVVGIRKELGFRTIFNFLGPLSNPAGVQRQVLGVSSKEMQSLMAEALLRLGTERALVVRGEEGLDELSLSSETNIFEIKDGRITNYQINPEELGLKRVSLEEIAGMEKSIAINFSRELLAGEVTGPYADLICLNAGAALYLSDKVSTIKDGISRAREVLLSSQGLITLEKVVRLSHSL